MAEMKNICGKIPIELHEKVRAEIELNESSTQLFIQQVIEEHFNRLDGKGEQNMEKRTLAVQISEELFQRVKWAVAKEKMKQKDFIIAIIEAAVEEVEAKWQGTERQEVETLSESEEIETAEAENIEDVECEPETESEEEIGEEEEMIESIDDFEESEESEGEMETGEEADHTELEETA